MKRILSASLLFYTFVTHAAAPPGLVSCRSQVEKAINGWGTAGEWETFLFPRGEKTERGQRIKGKTFGRWIEVVQSGNGPIARLITPERQLTLSWDRSSCQSKLTVSAVDGKAQLDFLKLLEGKAHGVVYLWSPHMPASIYGLKQVMAATKKLGIPLIPIVHPVSDEKAAAQAASELGLESYSSRILRAVELSYLKLDQHPPSLAVFKDNRWVGKMLPGAEGAETYGEYIQNTLRAP